jgi:hypothetical protein
VPLAQPLVDATSSNPKKTPALKMEVNKMKFILIATFIVSAHASAAVFLYPNHRGIIFDLNKELVTVSENGKKFYLKPEVIKTPKPWKRGQMVTFTQKDKDIPTYIEPKDIVWAPAPAVEVK